MNPLHIQAQEFTPQIDYVEGEHALYISGMSVPEDTVEFYSPVVEWFDELVKHSNSNSFTFIIKLVYFNTSSSKIIYDLLSKLQKNKQHFSELKIIWYYNEEDDYMFEAGNNFSDLVSLTFDFRPFE